MNCTIRPLRPEDYPKLGPIFNAAMPGNDDNPESLQEEDATSFAFARFVAEADGQVVGSASWFQLPSRLHPQKFWMDGAVHPDWQGRGIGQALLDQVLAAIAPKHPISIRTFSREDYAGTRRFLERRGFAEAKRTWESFLDLAAFDFGSYAGQPEQVEAQGIRLVTLPDLQQLPDWAERLLALTNAIQLDVPDFDAAAAVAMTTFQQSYLGASSFLPAGHYIALDGDRWVGLSTLWTAPDQTLMDTGLTGVLPEYRRRGIALALKLRSLQWASARGITRVRTTNASSNRGMLAINERLGFVKRPAWLHLVRQF
ncbi:MAG: GCN5-related N-acetyltransferase [Symbiobacteriaceae bacterium]|jgi:GNAT superfamily N-acetyltransferase|nr:GCN5-related N-acetyltransferase [Symbiobacteriaceae bacterium]